MRREGGEERFHDGHEVIVSLHLDGEFNVNEPDVEQRPPVLFTKRSLLLLLVRIVWILLTGGLRSLGGSTCRAGHTWRITHFARVGSFDGFRVAERVVMVLERHRGKGPRRRRGRPRHAA
jgi:hypothetical protein